MIFFYAATGAIVSFVLTRSEIALARWGLLRPIVMSFALAGVYFYAASLVHVVRLDVFRIRDELELLTAPELKVLQVLLWTFASLNTVMGVACCILLWLGGAA